MPDNKIHIPKDLNDCIRTLTDMLIEEDYLTFKNGTEEDMGKQHHFLGRWLRNEWGLWHESKLAKWFNAKGIYHADDMSGIILTSFWREINSQSIKLDEQIKFYQDYWDKKDESS